MDNEGYPEEIDLKTIREWDYRDVFNLIEYLRARWNYAQSAFVTKWYKEENTWVLHLEMHTIGWSGNEDLIEALLSNNTIKTLWYSQWKRGGHFYFEIRAHNLNYITVKEMAAKKGISRQAIHKVKEKYIWIAVTDTTKLCKEKNK